MDGLVAECHTDCLSCPSGDINAASGVGSPKVGTLLNEGHGIDIQGGVGREVGIVTVGCHQHTVTMSKRVIAGRSVPVEL